MSVASETNPRPSVLEEVREEAGVFWRHVPNKGVFAGLLAVWLVFFHFLGNSVFGYIDTASLLRWLYYIYNTSPDDGHGLLIPFVIVGLLYWKRKELIAVPKKIWWPGLMLVGLALMIHAVGYVVQFPQVSAIAFYFGIYAMTGLVWGMGWLRASFFPMLLFAFAVPLGTAGDVVTFPMRMLATKITVGVCGSILGIDVIRDGTQIFDPSRKFQYEVAAACGGIRSLTSLLGLATVYAFLAFRAYWRRGLIIFSAFPLAVAGNVFRLVCIIVAAEAFGQEAGNYVHDSSILSLLPYIPAIAGLLFLGYWLDEKRSKSDDVSDAGPITTSGTGKWRPALVAFVVLVGLTAALLGTLKARQKLGTPGVALLNLPMLDEDGNKISDVSVKLPERVLGYVSTNLPVTHEELGYLPKDTTYGRKRYVRQEDRTYLDASVVLMGTDRTSIHRPEICLDGQGWQSGEPETLTVQMEEPHDYDLSVTRLLGSKSYKQSNGSVVELSAVYVYWFVSGDRLTASHQERFWYSLNDLVTTGVLPRWAYVACFAPCYPGTEEATYERIKEFIAASVPEFQLVSPPVRSLDPPPRTASR